MSKIYVPFLVIMTSLSLSAQVVTPGATLQKLAGGFSFTEGATSDAKGNVFFTDQPNNRIMEWSVDGKLTTFLQPAGRANGMFFDAAGNLIACADEHNQLWSMITNYQGKYLNGPNDVWIAPNGAMFISDPFYLRSWWDHTTKAITNEAVYCLSPDRKALRPLTDDLTRPNGITGTPDGKNLYVSDIDGGKTWRYDILPDGSLGNKTFFCGLGSDGMTIDEKGNLYLTGHGVTVFDSTGKQIGHIEVHENWTGNLSFGGADHKTLFITASTSLYAISMQVRGGNVSK
jgi:gluconolactonase